MTAVAYLVNHYPSVTHTFIRREIQAIERTGIRVARFSVRGQNSELADALDREERKLTTYLLGRGVATLIADFVVLILARPHGMWQALKTMLQLARGADRPLWVHLAYLLEACSLHRMMTSQGISHVHAHFATNSTAVAMLCARLGGVTYSCTVHGPEEFDRPDAIRLGLKMDNAAFVAAITNFCRSQLFRWTKSRHWDNIHVVRCGLDKEFLGVTPTPVPETPQLVCVGRLCEQKAQLLLVQAAARLKAEGHSFKLVLAGDGDMRLDIESAVARFGLADHVRITGWIDSGTVRSLLKESRALVLPSFAEGLPVVVMEAMAMARPVVTTRIAGHGELVVAGQTGWLIDAGSVDALVDALREVLVAPAPVLTEMGQRAHARVAELHDVDVEVVKLAAQFRRVAEVPAVNLPLAQARLSN